ncbi:MAG: Uma2 family endonuclease, partial [Gemmataceae bacterium]|nr:Uma2 family endonuclease [Gemmataceae bacterium]
GYELIDGYLREKNMGQESAAINARINYFLQLVVMPARLGELFDSESMYRCFPSRPRQVRRPDVSYIRRDRLPNGRVPIGICRVAPDLAVEVISPGDGYYEVDEKVADYFDAGVPLVWVVSPKTRTVLVYHADGSARRLRDTDDLTADPVVPGFRVRVADLFPNPPEAADEQAASEAPTAE